MFGVPILALARASPMVRTSTPPGSTACAPKICPTRTRTEDFVRLLLLACPVGGLPRLPLRWIWLVSLLALSVASIPAARQQCVHRLAVMRGGIAEVITPDQLVFSVHIDVVPGAVMRRAARPSPAGINVFPGPFRGLVSSIPGHLARFDRRVFLAFVVGAKHRHNPSRARLNRWRVPARHPESAHPAR